MLFKVKYKTEVPNPNPEIQNVYAVRFEEKEGKELPQGETLFLFFDNGHWIWDYAYQFEVVE